MKSALILGNYRPSYILAKALKERDYRVICSMDGYERGAEVSRYVDALWQHPALEGSQDALQTALEAFLSKHPDIDLVCPVTEPLIKAFANGILSLPDEAKLISMPPELIQTCLDKQSMLSVATALEIPLAPFAATRSETELFTEAEKIGFPLVIRPLVSQHRLDGQKAKTVTSMTELKESWARWQSETTDLLIQAKAAGKRDNIYFAADQGKIIRYLHAKITRTDQPDGAGLAVEGKTISPCSKLRAYTEKLVADLDYHGIGCAQYLVDEISGAICFLELNSRIAGNHALPDHCGLDLSGCLVDLAHGSMNDAEIMTGAEGVKYGWLPGELEGIKQNVRRGLLSATEVPGAILGAFACFRRSDIDIAFNKTDPLPGIFTFLDALPLIGRLTRARFHPGWQQGLFIRKEWLS